MGLVRVPLTLVMVMTEQHVSIIWLAGRFLSGRKCIGGVGDVVPL
jgi:hypothetical protein